MKDNFKHLASKYLEQQSLDEQQLSELENLFDCSQVEKKPEHSKSSKMAKQNVKEERPVFEKIDRANKHGTADSNSNSHTTPLVLSRSLFLGLAASCLVVFILSFVLVKKNYHDIDEPKSNNPSLVWLIADEVAKNHIKMKPLEIETKSLDSLRRYFTELDFSVTYSKTFDESQSSSKMLGARYCSIQGVTAAQLRYENANGRRISLYEVPYDSERYGLIPQIERGESPLELFVRGLQVSVWVESGLLMVTANEIPNG